MESFSVISTLHHTYALSRCHIPYSINTQYYPKILKLKKSKCSYMTCQDDFSVHPAQHGRSVIKILYTSQFPF
jgi:hypothetical protein